MAQDLLFWWPGGPGARFWWPGGSSVNFFVKVLVLYVFLGNFRSLDFVAWWPRILCSGGLGARFWWPGSWGSYDLVAWWPWCGILVSLVAHLDFL